MRVLDVGSSAERLLNVYGLYHLSRLRADADAACLAEAFGLTQDALKMKMEETQDAEVAAVTAMAVRDAKDDELDDAVRALYFKLLQKVLNKREDPLFLRYFPDGMSAIIGPPPEEEIRSVGILLAKLGEEADPDLKSHEGPIQRTIDALSASLEAHEVAVDKDRLMREAVNEEKLRWIDSYKLSYRELQRRFYKDAKRAERYFRTVRKSSRGGEKEESTLEPVAIDQVADAESAG